jgi:anti-sigma B factor antagonist
MQGAHIGTPSPPVALVDVRRDSERAEVVMTGEFDLYSVRSVRDPIVTLMDDPPRELVIDMAGVDFIDSSGIALLVDVYTHVVHRGEGTMRITDTSSIAHRLLEICGLLETFGVDGESSPDGQAPVG